MPSDEVRKIFEELFARNHSPSSALATYNFDLKLKYQEDFFKVSSDGAVCPTQKWVYDLYYDIFKKEYGEPDGDGMIASMEKYIEAFNKDCGEVCAASEKTNIGFTVALCSPLMKRVHRNLENSKEISFIDSSGNMDRHNSRVFIMMSGSPIGALPLGLFVTYSESEECITQGLLMSIFPENAFFGQNYPSVIITDDSTALRNSLRNVFPMSKLLLCIFHVLQNVMRFMWLGKNNIKPEHTQSLYRAFQKSLYMNSVDEFENHYNILFDAFKDYDNLFSYLQS